MKYSELQRQREAQLMAARGKSFGEKALDALAVAGTVASNFGKIAEGYFRKNPELGIDFRRNVIILNKTPVHSAKTAQLNTIAKQGGPLVAELIRESQIWMAERTAALHAMLGTELWLVGYSELRDKKLFCPYRDKLKEACSPEAWQKVFVFQHFSMNRFTIDLGDFIKGGKKEKAPLEANLHELGLLHRKEIFGL